MKKIKIIRTIKGRVVSIAEDDAILISQNYNILSWDKDNKTTLIAKIPCPLARKLIQPSRLLCRLFRHEIRRYLELSDGSKVAASRQWFYYGGENDIVLKPASVPQNIFDVKAPMTITVDSKDRVLWGEYWGNSDREAVRMFVSTDKGKSYEPFYEFNPGDVRHIHNIVEDIEDDCYWVFSGDYNREPGIGRLSRDLKTFDWLVKGQQRYRVVDGFFIDGKIIYATDTEKEPNGIYAIDKKTGEAEKIADTPGSCVYAARFGEWYTVTTNVEIFTGYDTKHVTIYISKDGFNWRQIYQARKDIWLNRYFQFGAIVLPRGHWKTEQLVFSGQAVRGIDGKVCVAEIIE